MMPEDGKQPLVYALIPARGGSKSIKLKNIRTIDGIPLVAHSIETAKKSKSISKIFVSTDNRLIADISRKFGAIVPFIRPSVISQDGTRDFEVLQHFIEWILRSEYSVPEIICFLRPTYPYRDPSTVDLAIKNLLDCADASSLRSVCLAIQTPFKMWEIDAEGYGQPIINVLNDKDSTNAPRQELPPIYWQDGYVDCIRVANLLEAKGMLGARVLMFQTPQFGPELDYQEDLVSLNEKMYGNEYIAETNASNLDKVRKPS